MQMQVQANPILNLRLTEMETQEAILEHLKDISDNQIWKLHGFDSLQQYCQLELGYSPKESQKLLMQLGRIITVEQLVSSDLFTQKRIDKLKQWRKEKARTLKVRAFQVITNRTLLELARRPPKTFEDLILIYGIGQKRLEAHGHDILDLLA